jgi:hypothetical protein
VLAGAQRALHHRIHHREPGHGRCPRGQHGPQAAAQVADGRLHRLLDGEIALTKNGVIDGRIRGGVLGGRLRGPAPPRSGERAIANDGLRQRGPQARALGLLSVAVGLHTCGHGRWVVVARGACPRRATSRMAAPRMAVQRRRQPNGVGPAEPLAEPVRKRLAGFGDIEVRQASKDANERRAADGCALWGLQHTT